MFAGFDSEEQRAGRIISSMRSVPEQVAGPQHCAHREGVALSRFIHCSTHLPDRQNAAVAPFAAAVRNAEYPACFEALTRPKPGDRRLYSNLSFINQIKILLGGVERLATMVRPADGREKTASPDST